MIKKYITLAALLSAGTALANANTEWQKVDDVKITTTFNNTSGQTSINNVSPQVSVTGGGFSSSNSVTLESNKNLIGDGKAATNSSSIVPNINVVNGDSWTLNLTYNFSTLIREIDNKYIIPSIPTGHTPHKLIVDSVSLKLGATATDGDFVMEGNYNYYDFQVAFTSGTSSTITKGIQNRGVTATGADYNWLNGTGPQGNTIDITFEETQLQSTTLTSQAELKLLVEGGQGVLPGSIAIQSITFNTRLMKEVPAQTPEPSAFGLLAGLGALALVASRRRRK